MLVRTSIYSKNNMRIENVTGFMSNYRDAVHA